MQPIHARRRFLALLILPLLPNLVWAGAQKEETLADNVASAMRRFIDSVNPPYLLFSKAEYADLWLQEMSKRLSRYLSDEAERQKILIHVHYEASRAGLDPQLVLALIQIESAFRRYAISQAGARGLMQVMPFWVRHIGHPQHNLFDIRLNLRYGCTILRHYLNLEQGNLFRALGRYNGSLGRAKYPNAIFAAYNKNWRYTGPL